MTLTETPKRPRDRSDRVLQIAIWTFVILEAVGIAVVLWRW